MSHNHASHMDNGVLSPIGGRPWVSVIDGLLGRAIEFPAAILMVVEILVLLAGVVSRYVFHKPIVWSDELAGALFLWLAMLGSVIALRRGEHMRMTAIVSKVSPRTRAFLELFAISAALVFLLLVIQPSWEFAEEEMFIEMPALGIPNTFRAAAIPVGVILMAVTACLRLLQSTDFRLMVGALATAIVISALVVLGSPLFQNLGNWNLVIFFIILVGACVFAGVPIAFSFGLATLGYLSVATSVPLMVVVGRMDEGMGHLILLAVPLFVFLGQLIELTGMAKAMVDFLGSLLGHVRGGLSYVLIGGMYLVSGISGSKAADMAAIAPVLLPEMKERGSDEGDLLALMAATGAQTETIPPSLVLITIGSVTGVSIAALFTGGMMPAIVLGACLCTVVWWRHRHHDMSKIKKASAKQIGKTFLISIPAIALPFVIRAAVIEGVATATEVSTLGVLYAICAGLFIYRKFDFRRVGPMLVETAALSGAILLIIGAATAMAWALTQSGFSQALAEAMGSLPGGGQTFLFVSIFAFIILGSVLEGIPSIVLFGPLLFPIARTMGINEVHYSMVVVLAMGIGLFAPPFGVGYYSACAVSKINPDKGIKPILAYIAVMFIGLVVVALVPWISIGFLS